MKIQKLLRILHRDFGYFIVTMTVVYAVSGIYLNHRHDFNPDYKIFNSDFRIEGNLSPNPSEEEVRLILKQLERKVIFKKHYINKEGLIKVFIENGEVLLNPKTLTGTMQYLERRPLIFEINKLHRASIGTLWKWVSDIMAFILIFVAISGLFLLKGKRGFGRWGWWLTAIGIIIPLIFVIVFI